MQLTINNIFERHVAKLFVKPVDDMPGRLMHAAAGAAGETGEIIDAVKKHWIYNKPLDRENILEECGDTMFYLQALLSECGYTLDDAIDHNIAKLSKRYPNGYTDEAAQARADKQAA